MGGAITPSLPKAMLAGRIDAALFLLLSSAVPSVGTTRIPEAQDLPMHGLINRSIQVFFA